MSNAQFSIKNSVFSTGDECHYNVNADSTSVEVVRTTATKIVCKTKHGYEEIFTKREDGAYRLKGMNFGKLYHKFCDYKDPSF